MSATVIDSLVVTLGLDGSNYKKGAQDNAQDNKKLRDDAQRTAESLVDYGKQGGEFFGQITKKALEFFAVVAAGRGMEQLYTQAVSVGAATGRMAANIGTSIQHLSAWQNMMTTMGFSADTATTALNGLAQQQQAMLNGNYQAATGISMLSQRAHIRSFNADGTPRDPSDILEDLSGYLQKLTPQQAQYQGGQFGISPDMITILRTLGPAGVAKGLASDATSNAKSAKAAQDLQTSFATLEIQVDKLSTDMMVLSAPSLVKGLTDFAAGIWAIDQALNGNFKPLKQGLAGISKDLSEGIVDGTVVPDTKAPTGNSGFGSLFPRGLRNNNPGNLRYAGQPGATADADGFAIFPTMQAGIAALEKQIALDGSRGLNTVAKLVTSWEGGSDPNDTGSGNRDHNNIAAYIARVSKLTGFSPNAPLNTDVPGVQTALAGAISRQEGNGSLAATGGLTPNVGPNASNTGGLTPSVVALLNGYRAQQRAAQASSAAAAKHVTQHISTGPITVHTNATTNKGTGAAVQQGVRQALVTQANTGFV
jgi:hypothetical protein